MENQDKYKTLVDNTFLMSVGTLGSKVLSFLMVRFYTGVLSPSDYGTADLIVQIANLLIPVVSMGIADSVFRFTAGKRSGRNSVFSIGFFVVTAGSAVFVLISPVLANVQSVSGYIQVTAAYVIASCYHSLCAQFVKAKGKTALFAGQSVLNTVLMIGLNIVFLTALDLGIGGYILSTVIADTVCSLFLFIKEKMWRELTLRPEKVYFGKMMRYSLPLVPTTVFWWVTNVSDRYMVTGFLGSEANGIYAVACKIPLMLTIVSGIFLEAWKYSAVSEAGGGRISHVMFYTKIWGAFQAAVFTMGSIVIAFSRQEINVLSDDAYASAWRYVPVLTLAMVFAAFVSFTGSIYMVEKKSVLSFLTSMAGAVLNIALNWLLIPRIGVQGAAVATLASYMLSFALRARSTRKLLPFRLYKGRLIVNTAVLCVQIVFIVAQLPGWYVVQAVCPAALLIFNRTPIKASFGKMKRIKGR